MHDPNSVILHTRWLYIGRMNKADYHTPVPLGEVLNPLRYHARVGPAGRAWFHINEHRRWHVIWANFWWPLHPKNPRWRKSGGDA